MLMLMQKEKSLKEEILQAVRSGICFTKGYIGSLC